MVEIQRKSVSREIRFGKSLRKMRKKAGGMPKVF